MPAVEPAAFLLRNIWWAETTRIAANSRYNADSGKTPLRTTPVRAPSVVPISSRMASLTFVRRFSMALAALPQEQPMTETRLAPTAWRMSRPNIKVRAGTMKIPAAMPSIPPSRPAASETRQTSNEYPGVPMLIDSSFGVIFGSPSSGIGDGRLLSRVVSFSLSPR